jgi:hypothetical protein
VITAAFSFQWLLAWSHCVEALLSDPGKLTAVTAIGIEAQDANPFDDIVVSRRSAPDTYIQVKYAVDASTPVNAEYLTWASKQGGRSLLRKAAERWMDWSRDGGTSIEVVLATNRVPDPDDPVLSLWDQRTGLLVRANSGPDDRGQPGTECKAIVHG